jgi:hypothetical protein
MLTVLSLGRYDVDIVGLDLRGERPIFHDIAKLVPGNIFIEKAVMEGDLICIGCDVDWLLWNWRENTFASLQLKKPEVGGYTQMKPCFAYHHFMPKNLSH